MKAPKAKAQQWGRRAESIAIWLLRLKGYRVRAVNYKTPLGEADIIATRGKVLAIVEVKARENMTLAAEAISPRQQQRIIGAAKVWLGKNGGEDRWQIRFDAILVAPKHFPRHMMDAWRP